MDQDPFVPPASEPTVYAPAGRPFDPAGLPEPDAPPLPPREPVVLPWAPRIGWSCAGLAHRTMAVASLPVVFGQIGLAVWTLLDRSGDQSGETPQGTGAVGWLMFVSYLLAPPTFYAAARVLRPHVRRGGERAARHLTAATGTALGLPVVTMLVAVKLAGPLDLFGVAPDLTMNSDNQLAVLILLGVPAFLLGLVTSVWGAAASAVRAMSR